MYSPFSDSKGRPLTIEKVKFSHLSQLVDCDEGHHVEYKLLLEDGGKAQLAKEITSFANCEGGWLIVGIDDKTKEIKPIDKQDYSQRIGKIATRISPMPEFSTRFLTMPENKKSGVLLVYVYEGRNAPYVCNGSIYVRSGSSKEPIKPADRGNIEYLYERSREYIKEIADFCQRDYFYSYNNLLQRKVTYPIANIYLKNISSKRDDFFNVYGHIDFINRYGDYQNKVIDYKLFMPTITKIFKTLIEKSKGIEVNTSGYRYGVGGPHPQFELIKLYHDLGGKIITVGSDTHTPEQMAYKFDEAYKMIKEAGFDSITAFENKEPRQIKLF